MINSRSTPKEIIREYNRLKLVLASLMNDYTAFTLGATINKTLSELDEEYDNTESYFKDVEKRYKNLANH